MSDTPKTDGILMYLATGVHPDQIPHSWVEPLVTHARELERSLSEAVRERDQLRAFRSSWILGEEAQHWMDYAERSKLVVDLAALLLDLYDLRFKLAEREKDLKDAVYEDQPAREAALRKDLREYGEQKKRAWINLRIALAALSKNTIEKVSAQDSRSGRENGDAPSVPKFGCGASRTALADDLRARGDELSLEAADFIDCSHRKRQRLVWWPDGRAALHTEYHDGSWNEHAIDAEPKAVLGVLPQWAGSGNYTANDDTFPTRVTFANGRTVAVQDGHLVVGMDLTDAERYGTRAMRALERMDERVADLKRPIDLTEYPNLEAILSGRVSGQVTEWPAIRGELRSLFDRYCVPVELPQSEVKS